MNNKDRGGARVHNIMLRKILKTLSADDLNTIIDENLKCTAAPQVEQFEEGVRVSKNGAQRRYKENKTCQYYFSYS